jgi:hypothetical protein
MVTESSRSRADHFFLRLREFREFPRIALISSLWIASSYIDINIIVHYTSRVISGAPVETPLFIIYPICFSLMAGTVRWAFLWLAHKKDQIWFVVILVMFINAGVNWLVLLAISPGWAIPIRDFGFTVALMAITGGIFGAVTGIVLLDGVLYTTQPRSTSFNHHS